MSSALKWNVTDETGTTGYQGFKPLMTPRSFCLLPQAMFVVAAVYEDSLEWYLVEDEQGFRNLQEYWRIEHKEEGQFLSLKPFAMHKGDLVDVYK